MPGKPWMGRKKLYQRCTEKYPNSNSIFFVDRFISATKVAMYSQLSPTHVSKIFSGGGASVAALTRIAHALDMSFPKFYAKLQRKLELDKKYKV